MKYSTGTWADILYEMSKEQRYGKGNYDNVNTSLLSKFKSDKNGHKDDRVKLVNHPTHPKRGTFTKDGMKYIMTDFGMTDPNLTLFGSVDNAPDGRTTMVYKGGIVLPEITVTPHGNYIDNTYDNIKLIPNARYK